MEIVAYSYLLDPANRERILIVGLFLCTPLEAPHSFKKAQNVSSQRT